MTRKPRVLFVNRDRHPWPLDTTRRAKYDALAQVVELRVLGAGPAHEDETFRLVPPRAVVDVGLIPARVVPELRRFRPDAVFVQGVHETVGVLVARQIARSRAKVILDVHGDWRVAARLYGSRRRLLARLADLAAPLAVRRADAIRTISAGTTALVRATGGEPTATFPAYVDPGVFGRDVAALPQRPRALFVGVLERYKAIDVLLQAWERVPSGELHIVGDGSLRPLVAEHAAGGRVRWTPRLAPEEVAHALDDSWCLVLPSRSEGLPRVILEAFFRGRAVIASAVGGVPELIEDGINGILVPPEDADALAAALRRVLDDRQLADRLGEGAAHGGARWRMSADEWAQNVRQLVDRTLDQGGRPGRCSRTDP